MLSIKHVVRSRGDKKATILNTDMEKLIGQNYNQNEVTLYYHDYNCSVTYHVGDQVGRTWYANTHFATKMLLPQVGLPVYYVVSIVADNSTPFMSLENEFQPIRDWANKRGLYDKGDLKTQCVKLQEEVGELSRAILKSNETEIEDAIGDSVVVLTNLAALAGKDIEQCINQAFKVIANRKGEMKNGTFVKE